MTFKCKVTFLPCPRCGGHLNKATDSRQQPACDDFKVPAIRRRRVCDDCGERSTTLEVVQNARELEISDRQRKLLTHPEVQAVIGRLVSRGEL